MDVLARVIRLREALEDGERDLALDLVRDLELDLTSDEGLDVEGVEAVIPF